MATTNIVALCIVLSHFLYLSNVIVSAGLGNKRTATWNLQGSSASTESKWDVNVKQLVTGRDAAAVLAIQEAGSVPSTATLLPLNNRLINPDGVATPVNEYRWNIGTKTRPNYLYIYFSQNDAGANRVNVAIVTTAQAVQVIILRPPGNYPSARPILGVTFTNQDAYFSVHAGANGGRDAPNIVDSVYNYFASIRDYTTQWMIMGDFNRSPTDLASAITRNFPNLPSRIRLFYQNEQTQVSGGNLDYAVAGQVNVNNPPPPLNIPTFRAQRKGQTASDHYPVVFTKV